MANLTQRNGTKPQGLDQILGGLFAQAFGSITYGPPQPGPQTIPAPKRERPKPGNGPKTPIGGTCEVCGRAGFASDQPCHLGSCEDYNRCKAWR